MKGKRLVLIILIQIRDVFIALIFSVFITYFFAGKSLFTNFETVYKNVLFGFCNAFSLWKVNQFIGWVGDRVVPWKKNPKLTLYVNLSSSVFLTVATIFLVNYLYLKFVFNINFFETISRWVPQIVITFLISLVITIIFYLSYFFKWWRISTLNEAKLQQETIQLRYDALKSNVNPHFLFNSLSVLSSLVDSDPEKAKEFIQQFSNIYRYVLEQREKELVTIDEEIRFIKSFTFLHQIRHGENLKVEIDINDTSGYIIPLSLQILLENCFKHNIISNEKLLTVKVWREDNYIVVQNNLQKRKTIPDSGGIGLNTISKRYEFLSDKKIEIIVDSKNYTVKTPIISSDKLK